MSKFEKLRDSLLIAIKAEWNTIVSERDSTEGKMYHFLDGQQHALFMVGATVASFAKVIEGEDYGQEE